MRYVIYESMFGNTRAVAAAVAAGLGNTDEVTVVAVQDATVAMLEGSELTVLGAPTHGHSMSRRGTRQAARDMAGKPESGLFFEPSAERTGMRELLKGVSHLDGDVAIFDTRIDMPAVLTGRASKSMRRVLRRAGARVIAPPESFLVTTHNLLVSGELERARAWGARLASRVAAPRVEVGSE